MATKKATPKAAPRKQKASDTKLRTVKKSRGSIEDFVDEHVDGLASGKTKVIVAAVLDADGALHHFVTDGTASRVEIVGLAAELAHVIRDQKL